MSAVTTAASAVTQKMIVAPTAAAAIVAAFNINAAAFTTAHKQQNTRID